MTVSLTVHVWLNNSIGSPRITETTLWVLLSLSGESNSVISRGRLTEKERGSGALHLQLLWGLSRVSYKTARLLKPINGMVQSAPLYHCSAYIIHHIRSQFNSFLFSSFQWLKAKDWEPVDDFHLLWFICPLFMFTCRTSTQVDWEIIKQTHRGGCLLQCQRSQTKTLIKCVGSQTRWRGATQACMYFNIGQEF